ncbi:hypothetical protein MHYP_G00180030 [Metynnis hypsauchen]
MMVFTGQQTQEERPLLHSTLPVANGRLRALLSFRLSCRVYFCKDNISLPLLVDCFPSFLKCLRCFKLWCRGVQHFGMYETSFG